MKPEQTVVSALSHILRAHHMINLPPASDHGCWGSARVRLSECERRWSEMVDVGACNDPKEDEKKGFEWGEAAITLSITPSQPTPPPPAHFSLAPKAVPLTLLYFMYLHSWRCKGTARRAPSLWWAGEAGLCAGVIDDYGTTASGIMLAGAIYKQKHGLCLCQLWRILPFLSQTPLERALHSGSNVIFYWGSTIPHIEMAKESY